MNKFYCSNCNQYYPIDKIRWRCDCGFPLSLDIKSQFPIQKIQKRPPNLWRYREAIPILKNEHILSMGEGFTPLEEINLHGHQVFLKIDYLFPTGSYKDRGATVLISKVKELGIQKVIEDSSGNAGSAIAAYCAKGGIQCDIYVPETTSPGKLIQIMAYGANLRMVKGSREKTAEMARKAASKIYYASHCWNPFFFHGTKTFAFEVWEQMGWRSPDVVVLPVGHGTLLVGAYLGFQELEGAGMVKRIPRIVGIQSFACAPLFHAFKKGEREALPIEKKETMAEGIAIANPVRGRQILEAVRETGGEILTVTEREIFVAMKEMGLKGHFIEPTSAATIAGLVKYLNQSKKEEIIVSTLSGIGLKSLKLNGQE